MPTFTYIASDNENRSVNGTIDAEDRPSAIAVLRKQRLSPITIHEGKGKKSGLGSLGSFGGNKVKSDDLVMFTRQLSAMVSAGVPLLRALSSQKEHTDSKGLQKVLTSIITDIEGGTPLADALAKHPNTFGDVYVNMVRAGEAAGILDDILKRLALQQEKNATMRKKIKSAMT